MGRALFSSLMHSADIKCRTVEGLTLRGQKHLPARHHLTILQHHNGRLRNLCDLRPLVPCDRYRVFPMVPMGWKSNYKHQHTIYSLHGGRLEHHSRLRNYHRQLNLRLQKRHLLHEHHG